jgi:hypothetical protein
VVSFKAMPLYFFNIRDELFTPDEEGEELPDLEAAKVRATEFALVMVAVSMAEGQHIDPNHRIEVTDQTKTVLFTVTFGDVIKAD